MNAFFIIVLLFALFLYIYWRWKRCQNAAQKVNFFSGWLSLILLLELIGLSFFILFNIIFNQSIQSQFQNFTSTSYIKNVIIGNPTAGISILIGIISITTLYLYFFSVLGKTKYFSERSEIQEKYSEPFWRIFVFVFFGGLAILFVISTITKTPNPLNWVFFMIGLLNLALTVGIPLILKQNFFNLDLIETTILKKGDYDYKFLEDFQKEKPPMFEELASDIILIMTFMWVGIALLFDCNIFLLLMLEYSLLIAYFWLRQLAIIPHKKTTIELIPDKFGNFSKITDVFILFESSKGYLIVLDKNNMTSKIMKNSIYKLSEQS
jgi:hypothetical protein